MDSKRQLMALNEIYLLCCWQNFERTIYRERNNRQLNVVASMLAPFLNVPI